MKYKDIYQKSIQEKENFWQEQAKKNFWHKPFNKVLNSKNSPFYRWFDGGMTNICYNAVDRHVENGYGEQTAIIYHSEMLGKIEKITYQNLQEKVARCAGFIQSQAIGKGDRVLIYMPMIPEAVIAMLACARIGVTHSVVFGGFAANELATRIIDAKPRMIITASCGLEPQRIVGYQAIVEKALEIAKEPLLDKILIVPRADQKWFFKKQRDIDWNEAMQNTSKAEVVFVESDHPLYILYTSGTTGKPKGIVRDTAGYMVALEYSMEYIYDIREGEVWWSASDIGWVVGHSYIVYGPLLHRCTTILFEGKPVGTPDSSVFWKVINDHNVVSMFTAPTAIRAIKKEDPQGELAKKYPMENFRVLYLAGERCDTDTLQWSKNILNCPIIDNWWQTETGWPIVSNPMGIEVLPIKPGSSTVPMPGYDVQVLDDDAKVTKPGKMGSICIRLPLPPAALLTLWNDEEGCKNSYFKNFEGYYQTGDAGYLDQDGYLFIMSRTDDIINVAGHRLSTGGIEEVVSQHPAIAECAVTGVQHSIKGEIPFGFLVLKSAISQSKEEIIQEIIELVREKIGPVATFKELVIVEKLPKTRSGKILRKTLKAIINKEKYSFPSTIEDANVLDSIHKIFDKKLEKGMEKTTAFKGWLIEKEVEVSCNFKQIEQIPSQGVAVMVSYSTINYKDALALLDKAPIARKFPMIPGIDFSGKVVVDESGNFTAGEEVFLNGWNVGESYWGGLAEKARVPAEWLQRVPKGLDMQSCMALGTAGYTSMLCILGLLEKGIKPSMGKIAVSGASGGVGSFAVLFLKKLGFEVIAFTGKESQFGILKEKGASEIRLRSELENPTRPLEKAEWIAAVDTVGGNVLASLLAKTADNGVVSICGLTGGAGLKTTVMPFILRGVSMLGINSVTQPMDIREKAWQKIAELVTPMECSGMSEIIPIEKAKEKAAELIAGKLKKRIVIQVTKS